MLNQGAVHLRPADWPHGVNIVLINSDTGELCGKRPKSKRASHPAYYRRYHHFNITVGPNGSRHETIQATVIVAVFYLLVALIGVALSIIVFNRKFAVSQCTREIKEQMIFEFQEHQEKMKRKKYEKSLVEDKPIAFEDAKNVFLNRNNCNNCHPRHSTLLVEEIDGRKRYISRKNVADISKALTDKAKTKVAYKKSRLYIGALGLMSIFYLLPTIQMVFRFTYQQEESGNNDICYYNDLCRRNLGSLSDFNHLFREGLFNSPRQSYFY